MDQYYKAVVTIAQRIVAYIRIKRQTFSLTAYLKIQKTQIHSMSLSLILTLITSERLAIYSL